MKKIIFAAVALIFIAAAVISVKEILHGKKDTGISYYAKIIAGSEKKKNSECFYHIKGFDENGNDRMLTVYADQGQPYPKGKYLKITCSAKADGSNEMMWSMVKQSSIPKEAILKIRRWEKRIRQLAVKKSSQLGNNLNVQRNIDKTKKLIAFSFDDGPARENTDRVVKALAKNHARATFFMLGQNASYYPRLVKEVKDSGNEVAGHSWNHPQLTKLGAAGVCRQMQKMNYAISKVTGSDVGLLRPPYGAIDRMVKANINAQLILWSIDTLDWKTLNTDATVNTILKQAKDGDIVLMHDIHKPSVAAAEKVLPLLKDRGFEVCTVSELLKAKGITVDKGDVVISANQIYKYKKNQR